MGTVSKEINKEELIDRKAVREFVEKYGIQTLDEVEDVVEQMKKVMIEEILKGEKDSFPGYSKYDYIGIDLE